MLFCQSCERDICSVEDTSSTLFHQFVPSVSLVVAEEPHLHGTVIELSPLGRWDQGVRNTAKHPQIAQVWLSVVPNLVGAFHRGVGYTHTSLYLLLLARENAIALRVHTCTWPSQGWSGSFFRPTGSSLASLEQSLRARSA